MDPKKIAQLLTLLSPELARALLQSLEVIPKLERENKELRQTLEATTVELNRVNDRRIEAEALLTQEQAEFKEFRRRLLGALKPVGIEKGLLDIELAAVRTQELAAALAKIKQLEVGISAYRKRDEALQERLRTGQSAEQPDLDDADAWEASLIDVDGKPTQNS